jgi:putative aldouronate transport system substrate-binding protein
MKTKKILTLILALGVLTTSVTACGKKTPEEEANNSSNAAASPAPGPFDKYNEPVTINLVRTLDPNVKFDEGQSIEKNGYIDEIKKQFNIDVKFDWISAPADWDQKISLAISSNNLPDAVIVGMTQYKAMLKYGQIADLTSTFNNSASDLLKSFYKSGGDALKDLTEVDGKIMGIPATNPKANGFNEMWIRQDWLDKLGLEVPKNMEELKKVAQAFAEKDPDGNGKKDTIGVAGPSKSGGLTGTDGNQFGLDPIFSAHKSFPGYWMKDNNGQVIYGSTQPETKQALQTLADMYKSGLIDKEMLVRDDTMQPVLDNKAGIFFGPWWVGYNIADAYKKNPAPDWQAYAAPRAEDGNYYVHLSAPASQFLVVNKDYKHPEAAVKIINLLLRDEAKWIESGLSKNTGTGAAYPLFSVFDNVDELEVSHYILTKYLKGETDIKDVDFSSHKLLKGDMEAIKKLKKEPLDDFSINNWDLKSELVSTNLPRLVSIMVGDRPLSTEKDIKEVYSLYYGQTETMSSRWANLQKLEKETFSKIIMGSASIDTFDEFVTKWNAQGGEKILKEIAEIAK